MVEAIFYTGATVTWTRQTKKRGPISVPAEIRRVNRTTARIRIKVEQLDLFDGQTTPEFIERTVKLEELAAR